MEMEEKIKCPFCDEAFISVNHIPLTKRRDLKKCRAGSGGDIYSTEKWIVLEDCPNCGVSAKKIEKALNSGQDYKKPSRESVLERMRKAGLPTRI